MPSGLERPRWGCRSGKLSPNWNLSEAVQAAAGEQLEQYLPMPNGPDAPTTTFRHAQITAERAESIRPKGTKTRPRDTLPGLLTGSFL